MNVDSSINVFINEPFEMNMLCNGSTKMEEVRIVLGHTFMSYVIRSGSTKMEEGRVVCGIQ